MDYQIESGRSYSVINYQLQPGEKLVAESGSLAWMDASINMKTAARGGILKGMSRKLLGGESFFINTYTCESSNGNLSLTPGHPGETIALPLNDQELFMERGAFVACSANVHCETKWQGIKGMFAEGMFALRIHGTGMVFFSGYGDLQMIEVDGSYKIDNGFAVAWDPELSYRITRSSKIRSFVFADQLFTEFSGRGRLWIQSRSPRSLAAWLYPFRRTGNS